VTFFAADLTYDEVRVSYAAIWQSIGGKGTKGVKLEDVEFWRLVEYELGGPPNTPNKHGQKTPLWKRAQDRWNSEYAAKNRTYTAYSTWEDVRTKYHNLAKRLKSRS
jgi:hypothetical protein